MQRAFILTIGLAMLVMADGVTQDKKPTPAEQYKALLAELQKASNPTSPINTDEDRTKFVGKVYKLRNDYAVKFLALAEKYPNDPIAIEALMQATWGVNNTPWPVEMVGQECAGKKAFAIMIRDHIKSDKLGHVCMRISYGFCKDYEPFLRTVLDKSPHREVQAHACLGLAHHLSNRLQRVDLMRDEPKLAKEFADLFGADYLKDLQKQHAGKVNAEAEALFERAADKFGDVKHPYGGGNVGERAKAGLFEIRHLIPGKMALDIEAEDQDGKRFKLSDYRGKVVLLDFWSWV